ncbi:hypothetical protein CCHR01_09651 [Colletotrichum chrysophilum]|uniref:Uncharacterized protein n=1 Tax=Colletotrichum chrysophilum TaxID=1836956 RepID=A0AAD9AGK7_9PEZI|nr:hypothetical protein CCHR01_09651 [Colletotrichum chrysophilum]
MRRFHIFIVMPRDSNYSFCYVSIYGRNLRL